MGMNITTSNRPDDTIYRSPDGQRWRIVGEENDREVNSSKQGELDIPYVSLPDRLTSWLSNSIFFTGGKYIMTPASKEYVRKVVDDKLDELSRCAPFFEECDRGYVDMTHEQIHELQIMFGF